MTYQTTFDPNETENNEAINTATIYWTPGEEGEKQKGNVTAKTHFNDETKNMHWKNASYDPKTKKITWEIIVNYRENDFENLIIKDTPQGNQKLVPDSFVLKELEIDEDGIIEEGKEVKANIQTETTSMIIKLGETSKAYKIQYQTSLADLEEISEQYVNEADVFDGEVKKNEEPLVAEAGIYGNRKYADKKGHQEDNSKVADWEILVNIAQEKLTNLKLTDKASSNQEYIADSFAVYEVDYNEKGEVIKGAEFSPEYYDLKIHVAEDIDSEPSFELAWKGTVAEAYIVEYSTLFFAGHGEKISNSYELHADKGELIEEEADQTSSITIRQTAAGSASGKSGRLVVQKTESTYDFETGNSVTELQDRIKEGVEFKLVDVASGRVIKTGKTDEDGLLDFGRLLFGTYRLVEVVPDGYVAPENNKIITIDTDYSNELEK